MFNHLGCYSKWTSGWKTFVSEKSLNEIRGISFFNRPNDRIINVNGHPVVRSMEYQALKLIRDSTDFVHLVKSLVEICFSIILSGDIQIIQRRHQSIKKPSTRKCILTKTGKEEKFGLIIDCQYYIKKLPENLNSHIHEGDEIVQVRLKGFVHFEKSRLDQ